MEPDQFARLVDNFSTDGKMTGTVTTCWLTDGSDGKLEILSGHHRTEAAIAAGFTEIEVVHITTVLDEERKTAIQLSHNSISGTDNPSILAKMYESLDLDAKKFSGLTDDILSDLDKIQVSALAAANVNYEQLAIMFLPEDLEAFDKRVEDFSARKNKAAEVWAARHADFDRIFDAVVRVKHKLQIVNSALALVTMAELAHERLDEIEHEAELPLQEAA
jgi:hypothetical protein